MKKYDFGFTHRPRLRLSRIEEILRHTRVIDPIPSRRTIIRKIEDGTLDGYKSDYGYYVYEDSFKDWIRSLHPEQFDLVPTPQTKHKRPMA